MPFDIKDDPRINQWFEMSDISKTTRDTYLIYMQQFCNLVGMTPSQLINEANQEIRQGLLLSERKIINHITKFKQWLTEKKYAPKTEGLALSVIRSFYIVFDIQLPYRINQKKKRLPLKENRTFLTYDDVKKVIINAKNLRDKAIILCIATSGMGRQEIINLKIKDITFDSQNIGTINIRREKAQVDFVTFISPETTIALRNYFEERNRHPETAIKDNNGYVFVTYERNGKGKKGTQLGKRTFLKNFRELGEQLGYNNGKGMLIKSRSHAFRKFFSTTLENAGVPKDKVDFMLGHTPSGNDLAYFNRDVNALKELYIKYLPYITFEKKIIIRSLNTEDEKRLHELEQKTSNQDTVINALMRANKELSNTVDKLVDRRNTESFGENEIEVFKSEEDKKKKNEKLKNLSLPERYDPSYP